MKSIESKISRFYDVLEEELNKTQYVFQTFRKYLEYNGFSQIRTTSIELRERYLNAINVHHSKVFEVHRVKEKTRYALQSDLAISMSRFVSDLPQNAPLKLFQLGTMYRDRVPTDPGFRREFQQLLIGVWGIESLYTDAEILCITWKGMCELGGIKAEFIQISNQNIFNCLKKDLASQIRFEKEGIYLLEKTDLIAEDKNILVRLFQEERIPMEDLLTIAEKISNPLVKKELLDVCSLNDYLKILLPHCPLYFSLKNLSGTNHYSGMNYKIFISDSKSEKKYDIADGGRIDNFCQNINNRKIPGVCMGIGTTMLAQIVEKEELTIRKLVLLVDEKDDIKQYNDIIENIKASMPHFNTTVIHLKRKKWRMVFNSEFYADSSFILLDNIIEVRSSSRPLKEEICRHIKSIINSEVNSKYELAFDRT